MFANGRFLDITINIDMIKGIESDVGSIDFDLQVKRRDKFYLLHCFELPGIVNMSATRCQIEMEFGINL